MTHVEESARIVAATKTADPKAIPAWLLPVFKEAVEDLESTYQRRESYEVPEWYLKNRERVLDLYNQL